MGPFMKSLFLPFLVGLGVFVAIRVVCALAFAGIVAFDHIVGPDIVGLLWTPSFIVALVAAIVVGWRFDTRRHRRQGRP